MERPSIIISDARGNQYEVVAVKPYSSHPSDWHLVTVITMSSRIWEPYVVQTLNLRCSGRYNHEYCSDLTVAIGIFNRR